MMRVPTPSFVQSTQSIDFAQDACFDKGWQRLRMSSFRHETPNRDDSVMTVGIAMLCEGGKTAVMAADRKISTEIAGSTIQAETDYVKLTLMEPFALLAYTGDLAYRDRVLELAGDLSSLGANGFKKRLDAACQRCRRERLNRRLEKYGVKLADLKDAVQNQALSVQLLDEIKRFPTPGGFLVATADKSRTSLGVFGDENIVDRAATGFGAIGSGQSACYPICVARGAEKSMSLEDAAYLVYEAKRLAGADYGVGIKTDMAVVGVDRPAKFLEKESIDELETIYNRRLKLSSAERAAIRKSVNAVFLNLDATPIDDDEAARQIGPQGG
jgi:hypothetical protein